MEQDDLKSLWASYNQKLEQQLEFNRDILIRMNLEKSKKAISPAKNFETINLCTALIGFFFTIKWTMEFGDDNFYFISGLISSFIISPLSFYFSLKKLNYIKKLEFSKSSLSSLPKQILELDKKLLKYKKMDIIGIFFSGLIMCPIIFKGIYGIGLEESLIQFTFFVFGSIFFGILFSNSMYKNYYNKKLTEIKELLQELELEEK